MVVADGSIQGFDGSKWTGSASWMADEKPEQNLGSNQNDLWDILFHTELLGLGIA